MAGETETPDDWVGFSAEDMRDVETLETCWTCGGGGRVHGEDCGVCDGDGEVLRSGEVE